MIKLQLKSGCEGRFKSGHPWIFSNELVRIPVGIQPGEIVQLCDPSGMLLAYGFGNPHSLISFRKLSVHLGTLEGQGILSYKDFIEFMNGAIRFREKFWHNKWSHRVFFGEADGIPGLIVDYYRLSRGQVLVIQAQTAGADRMLRQSLSSLGAPTLELPNTWPDSWPSKWQKNWDDTSIIFRNDIEIRKLEGLEVCSPQMVRERHSLSELKNARVYLPYLGEGWRASEQSLQLSVDLLNGQKTGLFLDQVSNIRLLLGVLDQMDFSEKRPLRVLDLFSYVGHWGSQISKYFVKRGIPIEITCVDSSQEALIYSRENITAQGGGCQIRKMDVFSALAGSVLPRDFDIVIVDPPALIRGRKNLGAGQRGYLKLNTLAFLRLAENGIFVSCSCSSLLVDSEFQKILSISALKSQKKMKWIVRGTQAVDHPVLAEFPEGNYLKCWIGVS